MKYKPKIRRWKGLHCFHLYVKCRGPLCVSPGSVTVPEGGLCSDRAQTTLPVSLWSPHAPCSRVPSPPSKHAACLSLVLLLAPGLCPPRHPLHAQGSLDTAHFTLTLASLPLGVASWGGEGLPRSSKVLAGRSRILFGGTSWAPGAPWPCAGQEFNNCLLN